jgi:hypothetical protein
MTKDERQKLREAALAAAHAVGARIRDTSWRLPGSWELQTSNSFRRIGAHGDGDVLCATTQRSDGHPDLLAPSGVLEYVVAAQPQVVLELLDYIDTIELQLGRLDDIERHLIKMRDVVNAALKVVSP